MEQRNFEAEDNLLKMLNQKINGQRYWRRATSWIYSATSLGTITASFIATLLASIKYSQSAAVSAGLAALFVSVEKTLLFRDKWKIHRMIETELENVRLDLQSKTKDFKEVVEEVKRISMKYAKELPTE